MTDPAALGPRFAAALAARDAAAMRALLHPDVEFRALTPRRAWEADDPDAVVDIVLGRWFTAADEIRAVVAVDQDEVADRERVGYRLDITNPDGRFLVEQQAYLTERDGRIGWMRVLCTGYRPVAA